MVVVNCCFATRPKLAVLDNPSPVVRRSSNGKREEVLFGDGRTKPPPPSPDAWLLTKEFERACA